MSRWNWESYVRTHDDKVKENLGEDDFTVKGKYSFLNKTFKLSGKTKFTTEKEKVVSGADYTLTHNVSANTSYNLIHNPKSLTLDGSFHLGDYKNTNIYLYAKGELSQNEKEKKLPTTLKLRFLQAGDKLLSFGVEDVDFVNNPRPDVLSVLGLYGFNLQNGWRAFGGPYLAFRLSNKSVHFQRYLVGVKNNKFSGWLEASSEVVTKKVETPVDGKADAIETKAEVTKKNQVAFRFQAVANSNTNFGGDLVLDVNNLKNAGLRLYGDYKVDDATTVKARLEGNNKLTVGLTRKYGNLVNFGFVSALTLNTPQTAQDGTVTGSYHVKTKFGVSAEFSDAL